MSKVEVKFEFDTIVDSQNFYQGIYLLEVAEINIVEFQDSLYRRLKRKKNSKDSKEIQLLKEILDEYNNLFFEFVVPIRDSADVKQEKIKEKSA
jgi:hypothetical protein